MRKQTWVLIVLGILAIAGTAWFTAPSNEDSNEVREMKGYNAKMMGLQDHIQELKLEFQRKILGDRDYRVYRRCVEFPPTQPENIALCARLDRKVKSADKVAQQRLDAEMKKKW